MTGKKLMDIIRLVRRVHTSSYQKSTKFLWTNTEEFCDFPAFCDETAATKCSNTKLSSCEQCDVTKASLFLFVVWSLSFIVLISNIVTLGVGIYRRKRGSRQKVDDVRSSLAIADLFTGTVYVKNRFFYLR